MSEWLKHLKGQFSHGWRKIRTDECGSVDKQVHPTLAGGDPCAGRINTSVLYRGQ